MAPAKQSNWMNKEKEPFSDLNVKFDDFANLHSDQNSKFDSLINSDGFHSHGDLEDSVASAIILLSALQDPRVPAVDRVITKPPLESSIKLQIGQQIKRCKQRRLRRNFMRRRIRQQLLRCKAKACGFNPVCVGGRRSVRKDSGCKIRIMPSLIVTTLKISSHDLHLYGSRCCSSCEKVLCNSYDFFLKESLNCILYSTIHKSVRNIWDPGGILAWNSVIRGYTFAGMGEEAVLLFVEMLVNGFLRDMFTFLFVVNACVNVADLKGLWNLRVFLLKLGSELVLKSVLVVIALSGAELIYFERDSTLQLKEVEKQEMPNVVSGLDIAPIQEGRQRSRFLAIGSHDNTIRILSLDPDDCMQVLNLQSVIAAPKSLLLLEVKTSIGSDDGADYSASVFINAGLQNGVSFRTKADMVMGQLSETRSHFCGLRPPKLFSAFVKGRREMLCLSSRPWLGYIHQGRFWLIPLSHETLEYASSFSSDQCLEVVVAVTGDALRIFIIERLDNDEQIDNGKDGEVEDESHVDEQYGYPKNEVGRWFSCITILKPKRGNTTCFLELQEDEAVFSLCTVTFTDYKEYGTLLAVRTTKSLKILPNRSFSASRFVDEGRGIEFLHKTPVEGVPLALCQFQGKLLAVVGFSLSLHDFSQRNHKNEFSAFEFVSWT